jgi:hypothetical protein
MALARQSTTVAERGASTNSSYRSDLLHGTKADGVGGHAKVRRCS